MRKLGYTVTEHVGKYPDGSQAIRRGCRFENGAGPRLLLRTELDALPVEEKTGLDYASTVKIDQCAGSGRGRNARLRPRPAHDGAAGSGAGDGGTQKPVARNADADRATLRGDYRRVAGDAGRSVFTSVLARPDFVLSEHDSNDVPAGSISIKGGPAAGELDGIYVTMRGVGGHGSRAAGRQRSNCAGGGICAGGADYREPPDRSAAACGADRGHHSRRDKKQHHSRRSHNGADAAGILAAVRDADYGGHPAHGEWAGRGLWRSGGSHANGDSGRGARPRPTTIRHWPSGCAQSAIAALGQGRVSEMPRPSWAAKMWACSRSTARFPA